MLKYTNQSRFLTSMEPHVNSLVLRQEVILQRQDVANNFTLFWLVIRCGSVCGQNGANIGMSIVKFVFLSLSGMTNYEGLALETSSFVLSSWWKFYGWNHREDQSALAVYYFFSHSPLPGAFLAHFHAHTYVKGEEAGHGRGNWSRIIFPVQMANAGSVNSNQNYKFPILSHERKCPPKKKIESKMFNIHIIQFCLLL